MFIMKDNKVGPAHLKIASSPSYTLLEIGELAQRYTREFQCSVDDELGTFLELSRFIAWLAKREQGKGDER